MKTAKKFYYDYYKQDKEFLTIQSRINYSKIHEVHPSFKDDETLSTLKSFKPRYSNDYRLEMIYKEIFQGCNDQLRSKLDNVFIATYFDLQLQAYINEYPGEYEGSLVFFNVGLMNAIIEYSLLFAQYYDLAQTLPPQKNKLKSKLIKNANNLAEVQKEWRECGKYDAQDASTFYKLSTRVVKNHVAPYVTASKFVLCHEVAHSLLGHFYQDNYWGQEYFGVTFADILASPPSHQNEFYADIFSLFLSAGAYKDRNKKMNTNFQFTLEQSIGALFVFTILGQQSDITVGSNSHPSIENRFGIMVNTLKRFMNNDSFMTSFGLIADFQSLLYHTQKVGLGKHIPKDFGSIWRD